ncbi:heterokaryon incompatibility protein [Colletotrichum plurivorum]|uniref:Heterokaryon incompatibility protein n=1 Tax=Colletotrichum plurivorum TaxID=2175906 RepID=A0A8H6MYR7_9PEZI|nr:heterokaryon incompatibility protein [Colletotrichum plurivorum]
MALCNFCSKLTAEMLFDADLRFHPNLRSLKDSAAANCPFCILCYDAIQKSCHRDIITALLNDEVPESHRDYDVFYPSIWLRGQIYPLGSGTRVALAGQSTAEDSIWLSCGRHHPDVGQDETNRNGDPIGGPRLSCYALSKSPAALQYPGRFISLDSDPELLFSLVQERMQECRESHKLCNIPRSRKMPTRVITVDVDKQPRLLITNGLQEPYIALSYCWGPATDTFKLTHGTKDQLLAGVDEAKLAKTHQEAISFACGLGMRHIWIDALCIIQGDAEDWAVESRLMSQVFGNAALTVVAARSADSRDGFLSANSDSSVSSVPIPLYPSSNDVLYAGITRSKDVGPVSTRGWCFQEQKLSNRSVIFGSEQLVYSCRMWTVWEDGENRNGNAAPSFLFPGFSHWSAGMEIKKEATLKEWYLNLIHFSERKLSNPYDVFAAIASVAKLAQDILGSRYLAGLWEGDIVRGLLWKPRCHVHRHKLFNSPVTRPHPTFFAPPPVVRAPTWSWASIEGPVVQIYNDSESKSFKKPGFVKVKPGLGDRWSADEDCDADTLHMPFCELQLMGKVLRAKAIKIEVVSYLSNEKKWWKPYAKTKAREHGTLLACAEESESSQAERQLDEQVVSIGMFDVPEEVCDEVWCLHMVEREGLMLVKDVEQWRRVGWFLLERVSWFDNRDEVLVKLI